MICLLIKKRTHSTRWNDNFGILHEEYTISVTLFAIFLSDKVVNGNYIISLMNYFYPNLHF